MGKLAQGSRAAGFDESADEEGLVDVLHAHGMGKKVDEGGEGHVSTPPDSIFTTLSAVPAFYHVCPAQWRTFPNRRSWVWLPRI